MAKSMCVRSNSLSIICASSVNSPFIDNESLFRASTIPMTSSSVIHIIINALFPTFYFLVGKLFNDGLLVFIELCKDKLVKA